ncbi:MAG: alpha/beta hydrolase [Litorimonas sp.]
MFLSNRFLPLTALVSASLMLTACGDTQAPDPAMPDSETAAPQLTGEMSAEVGADNNWVMNGLAGTFRNGGTDAPVVLIVPGSGPTDRDGNNPMGVQAAPYRLLAEGLGDAGISTLRVDKRGLFSSAAAGNANAVTVDIYAQDYLDWAARLRAETGRDCVYMLGHSEGGPMVSAAAAQDNSGICGLILVASPGRPLFDVLREQLRANPANAPVLDDALSAIDQLESGERVDVSAMHPALQGLFDPSVQNYLISAYGVDPAALVKTADLPTLVLQGDNDIQISVTDAERLAGDHGQLVVLPGVNHVLKDAPTDQAGNYATYANPDLPLGDGVVTAITDFIKN